MWPPIAFSMPAQFRRRIVSVAGMDAGDFPHVREIGRCDRQAHRKTSFIKPALATEPGGRNIIPDFPRVAFIP